MQKIIALDIGSYSVKATEILNKFKSYEISNFYESVIPHSTEPNAANLPTTMEQIFRDNHIQADRIITAMPGQYISSRIMTFNFSDPSKIEAAVYSEIEDIVPFNLDDMIIDQQILGTIGGRTFILVVMTKKEFVGTFLGNLKRIGIDPKLVDVDSLSFYNLCPFLDMEKSKVYGIVDVGHEKTSVCLVQDNVLRMFRSINLGGRYITDFIARDMQVDFLEAQRIKHEVSTILTEDYPMDSMTPIERGVAERITIATKSIARELGRTLYAFKTWEKSPIERIYLSGGTSLIKNFDKYMTTQLSVESFSMNLSHSTLQFDPQVAPSLPVMGQGISIGIRAVSLAKKHSQINLRKGAYAYIQDYAAILNAASLVAKIVAVALLLLGAGYGAKFFFYNREINAVRDLYLKEIASIPELKKRVKTDKLPFSKIHKDVLTFLKNRVDQKNKAFENFIVDNGDSGALTSLQGISVTVPKTVKIDVVDYDYSSKPDGTGLLRLRVEADSYETIDALKSSLNSVSVLSGLVVKSSDEKPGTNIKIAVLESTYNPKSMK